MMSGYQQDHKQDFNQYQENQNSQIEMTRDNSINRETDTSKKSKRCKKIACTECRQQKAKCDASEKAPGPCTRCLKRKITCRLDGDFKRTFKRAKIDELVKEYEIIKSKLQLNPNLIIGKDLNQSQLPIASHQTQYSPQLKPIQHQQEPNPNFIGLQNSTANDPTFNTLNTLNNSSSLPDPNIFHPTNESLHIPRPSIPHSSSFKSHSPLLNVSRSQFSPSPYLITKSNSPLNPELNISMELPSANNSTLSTNGMIQPQTPSISLTPNLPSLFSNPNPNPNPTSIQSPIPKPNVNPGGLNNSSSMYNLTTLLSAASASVLDASSNDDKNRIDKDNNVNKSTTHNNNVKVKNTTDICQSNDFSTWKIVHRAVRKPKIDPSLLKCSPKSLGDVTLTEEQIVVLYLTFLTHYHPLLPVIDINKSIELIYRLCPALFWTIMFTALRGQHSLSPVISQSECQSLYFAVSPILKSVLAEITISPITRYAPSEVDEPILNASSVYSVQAFLIYTFWPPLTSSLSADSSWNTIGIAFYQAIRIGLHRPGLTSDRLNLTNQDLLNEQIRTWIACNIVSQTIASVFGFPGFFQPYGSLSLSLSIKGDSIPHCLRQMLEIQTFEEQVENTLNNNSFDPLRFNQTSERLPMIQLLENELNQLELRLCCNNEFPIDDFRVLSLYTSRLHLLSYYFLVLDETSTNESFELKSGFIKTFNAALAIIKHCQDSQSRNPLFLNNLPSAYILTIWQASVVIARLINSSYKKILDFNVGKSLYQTAIDLVMKASVVKHDLPYRSCGIMKSTWNLFRTLDQTENEKFKVTVKSRMSVNIFFDTLWILREKCGMIKLKPGNEKNNNISESNESDSDVGEIDNVREGETNDDSFIENKEPNGAHNKLAKDVISQDKESRTSSKDSTITNKRKSIYHPETAARRIINTIPLDPQPIGLVETPQDSNNSSKQGSPYLSNYKSPSNTIETATSIKKIITPQSLANASSSQYHSSPESRQNGSTTNNTPLEARKNESANTPKLHPSLDMSIRTPCNIQNNNESSSTLLGANSVNARASTDIINETIQNSNVWDIGNDLDYDMLFNDIESVMNEFGFHANY